jgi:hypothetical protein
MMDGPLRASACPANPPPKHVLAPPLCMPFPNTCSWLPIVAPMT